MLISYASLIAFVALAISLAVGAAKPKWRSISIAIGLAGLAATLVIGHFEQSAADRADRLWEGRYIEQKERADRLEASVKPLPRLEETIDARFADQQSTERALLGSGARLDSGIAELQRRYDALLIKSAGQEAELASLRGQLEQMSALQEQEAAARIEQAEQDRIAAEAAEEKRKYCASIAKGFGNLVQDRLDREGCIGWKAGTRLQ